MFILLIYEYYNFIFFLHILNYFQFYKHTNFTLFKVNKFHLVPNFPLSNFICYQNLISLKSSSALKEIVSWMSQINKKNSSCILHEILFSFQFCCTIMHLNNQISTCHRPWSSPIIINNKDMLWVRTSMLPLVVQLKVIVCSMMLPVICMCGFLKF